MSVSSRRTKSSTPSSILKKSMSFKAKFNSAKPASKVTFSLPHSEKLNSILQEFSCKKNIRDYENLVCFIRDCDLTDSEIGSILKEVNHCIPLLNQDLCLFVEALLTMRWLDRCKEVIAEYQSFLVNLASAHNYHVKMIIDSLVSKFLPGKFCSNCLDDGYFIFAFIVTEEPEWPHGVPPKSDCKKCDRLHRVIKNLLKIVPM